MTRKKNQPMEKRENPLLFGVVLICNFIYSTWKCCNMWKRLHRTYLCYDFASLKTKDKSKETGPNHYSFSLFFLFKKKKVRLKEFFFFFEGW